MLLNYLKIALRNLRKYKGYTFINVIGLAVGIAVCVLIFRYVSFELSFDEYHEKADRIYRVNLDHPQFHLALSPSLFLPTLTQQYPEVETGVRVYDSGSSRPLVIRNGERVFEERSFAYADSTLFKVFDFKLLAGNPEKALVRPNTIVISREMAGKYFGSGNPVGESLEVNGNMFEVTGVYENIPENSHFRFDFFASLITRSDWGPLSDNTWRAANFFTYLVLDRTAELQELTEKFNGYVQENFGDNEFAASLEIVFEPLTDIHLYSRADNDIAPQGDFRYVLAASAIAILILVIACINYMNLATARSQRRSREVGIRKVLGSDRKSLIGQFYGESAFLTILALGLSIFLIELFLPWFNRLTGQVLNINYASLSFWAMLLGTGIAVTFLAGSYPALMLSSFNPASVLKGGRIAGAGNTSLRKTLVVFQFAASIFLIICTLAIFRQIEFIQEKELGYKQDNVLVLTSYGGVEDRFQALRSELMQLPGVADAAMASETPTNIRAGYSPDIEGVDEGPNFLVRAIRVSPEFTDALNIEIVEGRSFTQGDLERSSREEEAELGILVNKATAAEFGLEPRELLGRRTQIGGGSGTIVGVVENFHFAPLHQEIEPLFIFTYPGFNKLLVSFNTDNTRQAVENTRQIWNRLFPEFPFEYEFLDQEYNALYRQEQRAGNIFSTFSILAIFVACLGLVGLASYMVERRTREIGVRKVLGASVTNILTLFTKDFLGLVMAGFLIALPIGWYVMNQWLREFAYRIDLGYTVFLTAGLVALLITLFTISYQAFKAARLDPVSSIRTE